MGRFLGTSAGRGNFDPVAAQVNSDWNASSGPTQILNKPTISAGSDAVLLFNCSGWYCGCAIIPENKRGVYTSYEFIGATRYWHQYCSSVAYRWAGACGSLASLATTPTCSCNSASCYCCSHAACGWFGDMKCSNGSTSYTCAGQTTAIFGCNSGCETACSSTGFQFHHRITPFGACCGEEGRGFHYCSATSRNGPANCCIGVRNSGFGCPCCGAHSACLQGVCFTVDAVSDPFGGANCSMLQIYGYGKLSTY